MDWLNTLTDTLWRTWLYITTAKTVAIILGVGFALLAITLFIASRTKWGQSKPLTKCLVLSVLAHVWLLMYALGTKPVLPQGDPSGSRQSNVAIRFEANASETTSTHGLDESFDDLFSDSASAGDAADASAVEEPAPWERPVSLDDLPLPTEMSLPEPSMPDLSSLLTSIQPSLLPDLPPEPEAVGPTVEPSQSDFPSILPSEALLATAASTALAAQAVPTIQPVTSQAFTASPEQHIAQDPNLPAEYALRQAPNKLQIATAYGADADSEAAVNAGLKWLAGAQSASGAWVARDFGAGSETYALGLDRKGTGSRADTGVSGLALLAFLSAGHTHLAGDHQPTVQRGLQFLLEAQMPSGDLSGPKQLGREHSVMNAKMYCHAIATLSLAEAYAMTHDRALRDALLRAAQFSINAQDPIGGGWRYRHREPGDLSQFGWQAMALKSVARSGITVPNETKTRMRAFLDSCAAGDSGGLATYRPGEGRPSETMTAEALACRLLIGHPLSLAARREALDAIMANLPGTGQDNVYYWYYATLALFQLQDENWRVWNQALKSRLLTTQQPVYATEPGSWEPDALWGGYGGRVYSTAMSCLCLEVYYRFLPMYKQSNVARTQPNSVR